jgi:hypothetical protein
MCGFAAYARVLDFYVRVRGIYARVLDFYVRVRGIYLQVSGILCAELLYNGSFYPLLVTTLSLFNSER